MPENGTEQIGENIKINAKEEFLKRLWSGLLAIAYCICVGYLIDIHDEYKGAVDTNLTIWASIAPIYLIVNFFDFIASKISDDNSVPDEIIENDEKKSLSKDTMTCFLIISAIIILNLAKNFALINYISIAIFIFAMDFLGKKRKTLETYNAKQLFCIYLITIASLSSYLYIVNPTTMTNAEIILRDNYEYEWYNLGVIDEAHGLPKNNLGYYHFVPKNVETDFSVAISVDTGEILEIN